MTQHSPDRIVKFRPKLADIHHASREIADEDRRVYFGAHANERMVERGITRLDALRVLQRGHIEGSIEAGQSQGEWKCKVVGHVKGSREVGVVTIVKAGNCLFVKTVEWED